MNKQTRGTEPSNAPMVQAQVAYAPRPKTIERQGQRSEAYTRRWPQVRGGTCEFCGVLDNKLPAELQYQLCPHFRDFGELRCSYCDESVDPTHVVNHAVLNIAEHPDDSSKLVVWCNSYSCSGKHEARFKRNH